MHATYHFLFEDEGTLFSHLRINDYCICIELDVYVCVNFEDEILLRGKNVKTLVNLKCFQNGKLSLQYWFQT